jgi:hypothetical protein
MSKNKKTKLKMTPPGSDVDLEELRKDYLQDSRRRTQPEAVEPQQERPQQQPEPEQKKEEKKEKPQPKYPWEKPGVSDRVIKQLQLRLKEPDWLRLKYVVENSSEKSLHSFLIKTIKKELKKQLDSMLT